jgi:hypothetical protein
MNGHQDVDDAPLKTSARVEAEIRERIKFLENRIAGHRKHARTSQRDELELGKPREFLRSLELQP